MKILQVSNRVPYPLNEGGTIGIYNYTRGYAEAGCEVTLFAQSPRKHQINESEVREALEPYCRLFMFPVDTDVKPIPALLNLLTSKSYNIERFNDFIFREALAKHLQEEDYDVIQIEGTFPAVFTPTVLKHRSNAKVVLRQHNVEYQIWERLARNTSNPIKKWYLSLLSKRLKRFERKHLNHYDALVPVTVDDGNLFKAMGSTIPIQDSPAGIDINKWAPSASILPMSIFHIGSLEWMPNLEAVEWFLDDIWDGIYNEHPEAKLYIAGKAMPDSLKERKIQGVEMVGEIDSAPEFVQDKSITVVPLKSGSGIRLKILEAMSAGKIVISTTIGAQGISYTNGKDLIIADNRAEFLAALNLIKSDPKKAESIRKEARRNIVENYSNAAVIKRLLNFYKNL